jgi:hypothetical protein
MSSTIAPGARVLVRWAGLPKSSPCHLHLTLEFPLLQNVGAVDRIDERYGEHCVIVVFRGIACPPFGAPWVDAFTPDELMAVDEPPESRSWKETPAATRYLDPSRPASTYR